MTASSPLAAPQVRRLALWLVACALLFRVLVPAGWMPVASANGITLNWCSESQHSASAEARAMLAAALGKKAPDQKPVPDQPCTFAAAAQSLTAPELPAAIPAPIARDDAPAPPRVAAVPGRGLAAPPPRSTGPPRLA